MIHVTDIIEVGIKTLTCITFPILIKNSVDTSYDVKTNVHFVPIDSEGRKHNLLIRLT